MNEGISIRRMLSHNVIVALLYELPRASIFGDDKRKDLDNGKMSKRKDFAFGRLVTLEKCHYHALCTIFRPDLALEFRDVLRIVSNEAHIPVKLYMPVCNIRHPIRAGVFLY